MNPFGLLLVALGVMLVIFGVKGNSVAQAGKGSAKKPGKGYAKKPVSPAVSKGPTKGQGGSGYTHGGPTGVIYHGPGDKTTGYMA